MERLSEGPCPPSYISLVRPTALEVRQAPPGRVRPVSLGRTLKKGTGQTQHGRAVVPQTLSVNIPSPGAVLPNKEVVQYPLFRDQPLSHTRSQAAEGSPPVSAIPSVGLRGQRVGGANNTTAKSEVLPSKASAMRAPAAAPATYTRPTLNTWTLTMPEVGEMQSQSAPNSRPTSATHARAAGGKLAPSATAPTSAPAAKTLTTHAALSRPSRKGMLALAARFAGGSGSPEGMDFRSAPLSPPASPPTSPPHDGGPLIANGRGRAVRFGELQTTNFDPTGAAAEVSTGTAEWGHSGPSAPGLRENRRDVVGGPARPALGAVERGVVFVAGNDRSSLTVGLNLGGFECPGSDSENDDEIRIRQQQSISPLAVPRTAGGEDPSNKEAAAGGNVEARPVTPPRNGRSQYLYEYVERQEQKQAGAQVFGAVRSGNNGAQQRPQQRSGRGGNSLMPPGSPLLPWFEEASNKYQTPITRKSSLLAQMVASGNVEGWDDPSSGSASPGPTADECGSAIGEDSDKADGYDPTSGLRRSIDTYYENRSESTFDHASEILRKKEGVPFKNLSNEVKEKLSAPGPFTKAMYLRTTEAAFDGSTPSPPAVEQAKIIPTGGVFSFERLKELEADDLRKQISVADNPKPQARPHSAKATRVSTTLISGPTEMDVTHTEAHAANLHKAGQESPPASSLLKPAAALIAEDHEDDAPMCTEIVPAAEGGPMYVNQVVVDGGATSTAPRSLAPELNNLIATRNDELRSSIRSLQSFDGTPSALAGTTVRGDDLLPREQRRSRSSGTTEQLRLSTKTAAESMRQTAERQVVSARTAKAYQNFESNLEKRPQTAVVKVRPTSSRQPVKRASKQPS